ncbi:ion transporter [Thiofilum flexile]|uniref:ion transporter n=1 Tax=Thiofilum flexile TaxID=125627 RepID=UPI000377008D|nr:ion transporter [Thiofilum flexile]
MVEVAQLRHWFYQALEQPRAGWTSGLLNSFLGFMILLTVIAVILESEADFYAHYQRYFILFEIISVGLFTLEYLIRVWVSVEDSRYSGSAWRKRLHYILSPMALIDLVAILPAYIGLFVGVVDLRMLRSIRLLRILKLTRYSRAMNLLATLIRQEAETMLSALLVLVVLILISATGMYMLEGDTQPQEFGSIPRALWWSVVTLTTIGYGDAVPMTNMGKVFAGLLVIGGIAVASLPAAILSSGLINELNRRREAFRLAVYSAYNLGHLSASALAHLEQQRHELGVSHADARSVMREIQQEMRLATLHECPHCHKSLRVQHHAGQAQVHAYEHEP